MEEKLVTRNDLEALHDIFIELDNRSRTDDELLKFYMLELPSHIRHDAEYWGVDTVVGDKIYEFLKGQKNELATQESTT